MRRICLVISLLFVWVLSEAQPIHIWEGTPVKADKVILTPYLPGGDGLSPAVIVCPGGSYFWLDKEHEGQMVAEWLRDHGFAAFVLEYRTGGWFDFTFRTRRIAGGNMFPDMIQDIQRSISLLRSDPEKYGIDQDCIGAMGFSAGGHLVMSSAEFSGTDYLSLCGVENSVSLRPDFVVPVYPVVSMVSACTHARSRRGLLGERLQNDSAMRDSLSLELHVKADTPPVFLLNCLDDNVVDPHNSELLDSALTAKGVSHSYIQYNEGGHGFGACPNKFTTETSGWQESFLNWFHDTFTDKSIKR